jgi:hypothetical protein
MSAPNIKRFQKAKSHPKHEPPARSQRFHDLKKSHASPAHADHASARPSFARRLGGRGLAKPEGSTDG